MMPSLALRASLCQKRAERVSQRLFSKVNIGRSQKDFLCIGEWVIYQTFEGILENWLRVKDLLRIVYLGVYQRIGWVSDIWLDI